MVLSSLPTDRAALEALVAEVVAAERAIAERIVHHRSLALAIRQAGEPRFWHEAAQEHLLAEVMAQALLLAPCPLNLTLRLYVKLPRTEQFLAMEPLVALRLVRAELIGLHERTTAALAELDAADQGVNEAVEATLAMVIGSEKTTAIVRLLAERDGRCASLDRISMAVYGVRESEVSLARKNTRDQVGRAAKQLDRKGAPLRITIDGNTAYLVGAKDRQLDNNRTTSV